MHTSTAPTGQQSIQQLHHGNLKTLARLQKSTDLISTDLSNKNVITYTQPSLNVIIVLTYIGIYKINALKSGYYSLIYNGLPYSANYFVNILFVNGLLFGLLTTWIHIHQQNTQHGLK